MVAHCRGFGRRALLKRNRIRRFDASHVLAVLRQQPVTVAAGTMEAASAHIATLIARIRLLNKQLKQAHERLDALTSRLALNEEAFGRGAASGAVV